MPSPTAQRIDLAAECRRCGASWQCTSWGEQPAEWEPFFASCPLCWNADLEERP